MQDARDEGLVRNPFFNGRSLQVRVSARNDRLQEQHFAGALSRRRVAGVGAAGVAEGHEGGEDFFDPRCLGVFELPATPSAGRFALEKHAHPAKLLVPLVDELVPRASQ